MASRGYSTGLELVLCSCEQELIVVLTDNEKLVSASVWALQDHATELLAPTLKQMMELSGHGFQDLRRVGCVRGPGSFTGIRLVLSTAAALRRVTKAKLAALDYMRALATTAAMDLQLLYGRRIWVLTRARRDLVHAESFLSIGPVIPCASMKSVRLLSPEEAKAQILRDAARAEAPVVVVGSALSRDQALADALLSEGNGKIETKPITAPSIDALRLLGRHGDYFPADVEPLYIRPCDAVDNLPALSRKMGRDADDSVRELNRLLELPPEPLPDDKA